MDVREMLKNLGIIFSLLLMTCLVIPLNAQTKSINEKLNPDSLSNIVNSKKPDSVRARASFLLSRYWSSLNPKLSQSYLDKGRKLGATKDFLEALFFYYDGELQYKLNNITKSNTAYLKAEKLLSKVTSNEARKFKLLTLFYYADNLYSQGNDKAVISTILNQVIPLTVQEEDSLLMARSYGVLYKVFNDNSQYEKADLYINKAIALMQKIDPKSRLLLSYYLRSAFNACYQYKFDKVKKILDLTKDPLKKFPDSKETLDYYEVSGIYYMEGTKEYDKALASLDKGLNLAGKIGNEYKVNTFMLQKYDVYVSSNQYKKGIEMLKEVSKAKVFMKFEMNKQSIYREFNRTYELLGDVPKAYFWLKKYNKITDSLNETRLRKDINELEVKFRNAENKKRIATLEAEKERTVLSSKNNRLMIWLFGIGAVLLFVITIFTFSYYRSKNKLVSTHAMLEGEERERRRVARDLHDGLGGLLAGVKIKLSGWAANQDSQTNDAELDRIIYQLDNSVKELRYIARNMMPESLLKFGLETALKDLCESAIAHNTSVVFQPFSIGANIPTKIQLTIFRIVQELLSNAIRHAQAQHIIVQCSQNERSFFITVEDDGIGFDPDSLAKKQGIGLSNIQNRVNYLNGKMEIISTEQEKGTTVNIELHVTT